MSLALPKISSLQRLGLRERRLGAGGAVPADLYHIATSRFSMPTDWSTTDTGFLNGNDATRPDGGNGTISARHGFRRFKFRTAAWGAPLRQGRFLFENSSMTLWGVRPSKFGLLLPRAEIRTMADTLVEALKFNGAASRQLVANTYDFAWNDPLQNVDPDTDYFIDVYFRPDDNSSFPVVQSRYLTGECSAAHATTDYSLGTPPKTNVFATLTGMWGPSCFVARGKPAGRVTTYIVGTSIADYADDGVAFTTARGVTGMIQRGLDLPANGGSWDAASGARFSSGMQTVYQDNLIAGVSGATGPSRSLVNHLAVVFAALGQSKPPFNLVDCEHGRNNIGLGFPLIKTTALALYAAIRQAWPSIPIAQMTTPPDTSGTPSGNTAWTTEAGQTPVANNGPTGALADWNAWIRAGGEGQISVVIDGAAAIATADGSKWKEDAWSTTVVDALAAGLDLRTNTIRLADAPNFGDQLVFEPGTANTGSSGLDYGRRYCVLAVAPHATSGFNVTLRPSIRAPGYQDYTKGGVGTFALQYAHAAGTLVRRARTADGIHPSEMAHIEVGNVVNARKPAMAAVAAVYEAA